MTLLLYGVVRHGLPLRTEQAVTAIEAGDLTVLATELEEGADVTDDAAIPYLDALTEVIQHGPVVPIRFGTVAPNADAVIAEVIEPAADSLRGILERTEQLVELRIDFTFDEDAGIEEVYREDPEIRAATKERAGATELSEQVELGRLVAQRVEERRAQRLSTWLEPVRGTVMEIRPVDKGEGSSDSFALLVRRDRVAAVDDAVAALSDELDSDVAIDYAGPLPLFSYLDQLAVDATEPDGPSKSRWGWENTTNSF